MMKSVVEMGDNYKMKNHVTGRNVEVTDAIKAYVKEKIGKVASHYDQIQSIETLLSVIKNPSVADSHVAEVNCQIAGDIIRVEEQAESMYASIDLVADKLERQVRKYKEKHQKAGGNASIRTPIEE
ncbi:MAG: ribosome-associated translation inhibitor RaiA [Cyanobacteria bacterium SIG30]|nr:ribosome-associated translation inhibitor RaiA [Cyanobacteria bacterium SIG30]